MTRVVEAVVVAVMAVGGAGAPIRPVHGSVMDRPAAPVPAPESRQPSHGDDGAAIDPSQPLASQAGGHLPSVSCLAATLCAVKQRVRWRTAPWSTAYCHRIAQSVLQAAEREKLSPALLVAVMINESSLDAYAARATMKGNTLHARDGGLMGIRCILDGSDRCTNGRLRGMRWSEVLKPETNIALGARALAYWRDAGGVVERNTRARGGGGVRKSYRRCPHQDHAWWAHYNHGERYISRGPARHYPHRIGVLYYALARTMNLDTGPLTTMALSVVDTGRRPRTADRPVEPRHVSLCRSISSIGPVCGETMTADHGEAPVSESPRCSPQATPPTGEACGNHKGQGG
jgi:hypothetical protein